MYQIITSGKAFISSFNSQRAGLEDFQSTPLGLGLYL